MSQRNGRRGLDRQSRIETCEDRLVMSADPVGQIRLDQFVERDDIPIQHQSDFRFEQDLESQLDELQGIIAESLADSHASTGVDDVWSDYGFTGAGQTVAVIDSGIAWNHAALGGGYGANYRVVGGWDFAENDSNPYDDGAMGSHGTHVAGIIGASAGVNTGVAPGVDLVALRVFADDGAGYFSWVEQALSWVHTHKDDYENPITTVNLSLGTNWNSTSLPNWAMLEDEFAQLEADGIFISVAAGNSFTSYNAPGLSYPAASSHVVPVMAADANGDLSYFSQRASRAIAAPGRSIISTVPDYAGNQNGVADDFLSMSGTSMAAPYVAGASVLLRQAMEFKGMSNITEDSIYAIMRATADTLHDTATNANYLRLNVGAAIASIMGSDDYGSTAGSAESLGTLVQNGSLQGTIGKKSDVDYFSFTALGTGQITFSATTDNGMSARWLSGNSSTQTAGSNFTMNVVAGQTYQVGITGNQKLGNYTLSYDVTNATFDAPVTALNTVTQRSVTGLTVDSDGQYFQAVAGRSGYFTVETAQGAGSMTVEIYSANMTLLASQSGAGTHRLDIQATAGQTLFVKLTGNATNASLKVTNLVRKTSTTLDIAGTASADAITLSAGSNLLVNVNGTSYTIGGTGVSSLTVDGKGGADSFTFTGTAAAEVATLRVGSTTVEGSGYTLVAQSVESVVLNGGGGADCAAFYDSAGNDVFEAWATSAQMTGSGFSNIAANFGRFYAGASAGTDKAILHDNAGDNLFTATTTWAVLNGGDMYIRAEKFDEVQACATAGGADTAKLYDSAGNDKLTARPDEVCFVGTGFKSSAAGFDKVYAYASKGKDAAQFYDSAGNDQYKATPKFALMWGAGYSNYAENFDVTSAISSTGVDTATLLGSAASDTLRAYCDQTRLYGSGFDNNVKQFCSVTANGGAGADAGHFYKPGSTSYASSSSQTTMGNGYWNVAGLSFSKIYRYADVRTGVARVTRAASVSAEAAALYAAMAESSTSSPSNPDLFDLDADVSAHDLAWQSL